MPRRQPKKTLSKPAKNSKLSTLGVIILTFLLFAVSIPCPTNAASKETFSKNSPKKNKKFKLSDSKKSSEITEKTENKKSEADTQKNSSNSSLDKDLKPLKKEEISSRISEKLWQKLSAEDVEILKKINDAIQKNDFDGAIYLSKSIDNSSKSSQTSLRKAIIDIILWNKFSKRIDSASKIPFDEIADFAIDNPYLPNLHDIRKNAETLAIQQAIPFKTSERYFATYPPLDSESKLFVVESKIQSVINKKKSNQNIEDAKKNLQLEIQKLWVSENFSQKEEQNFLEKYGKILTEEDHIKRIERLLWDEHSAEAQRIFGFINQDDQKLYEAIIKISELPVYIDNLITSIPRKLRSNELLVHRVVSWHKSRDNFSEIVELMENLPKSTAYPQKWWKYRILYGRELLKRKNFKSAYKILSRHNLPSSSNDFWEAEWTSGWIALRFNDEPRLAIEHFTNLLNNVSLPVSLSRAYYWLGMAYQQDGNKDKAVEFYKKATVYPTFFYGQLAIHKHRTLDPLNAVNDIILPKDPDITARDLHNISNSRAAQIAYLLALTGDKKNSSKIFEWLILNSPTEGQIAVIMKIVNQIEDRQLDAKISRIATRKNVFFIRDKFQIIQEVEKNEFSPLVHAIIKQESNFAPSALSKVGAIGYMQIMPDTAKLLAKQLGIDYNRVKLATDINYNVKLGSFYIKKLLEDFEGSEILAIASYNAGPNSAKRWINDFYDPRDQKDYDKVIDWIELITYPETRNYVQRIIENLIVYKYLMSRSNYDSLQ